MNRQSDLRLVRRQLARRAEGAGIWIWLLLAALGWIFILLAAS